MWLQPPLVNLSAFCTSLHEQFSLDQIRSDQPAFSFSSVYTVCCLIQLGTCHTTTASVYELQPVKQSRPCNAIACQTNLSFSIYYHSHMYMKEMYMQEKQKFLKSNCTCTVSSLFMVQKFIGFLILWYHERDGKVWYENYHDKNQKAPEGLKANLRSTTHEYATSISFFFEIGEFKEPNSFFSKIRATNLHKF